MRNMFWLWSLRSAAVTYWTAMPRSGVQFPVGTVYFNIEFHVLRKGQ